MRLLLKNALLISIGALAVLAIGCGDDDEDQGTATSTAAATTPAGATPVDVCQENPDPATSEQVQVTAPEPGAEVTSPLQVTGLIAAFEAQFNIALKDAGGNTITEVNAMSAEGQTLAPFSASVVFTVNHPTPVCLWVFDYSEMDGEPSMIHQVPVTLLP